MLNTVILVTISIFVLIYYLLTKKFNYWKRKNVPYIKPLPLFGTYKDYILLKTSLGEVTKKMYEQLPDEPCIGVFYGTEPALLVQDPALLKLIMTKEFYYFHGREISKYVGREPITQGVFFNHGDKWKVLRQNFTPLFSVAKMKNMFPLIEKCTHSFSKLLQEESNASSCIDANKLNARFTIDCVCSCVFGIETNVMHTDHGDSNPYFNLLGFIFNSEKSDIRGYKNILRAIWPQIFYGLGLQIFPTAVKDYMIDIATNVFKLRDHKPTARNDFVDLLLSLVNQDGDRRLVGNSMSSMKTGEPNRAYVEFHDELMSASCVELFGGGAETSATTLTLTLFELAKNPKVQFRVQKEIDDYLLKCGGKIEYECVNELPYLTACVDETLRMYPVSGILTREVMDDYTFPNGLHLNKGVRIHIPVYYIQHNPKNFPEPEKYRPERFLPAEANLIKPYTYLPFGEGPRNCLGMRFGRMQMQAGLITIFKDYNVYLAEKMSKTVTFDPRLIVGHTLEDVNLNFESRKNNK